MTNAIPFRKMNGLGNDFVVLDLRGRALDLAPSEIRAIADRDRGIGCDQVIALEPSADADVFMRIWNADGGEVGACGDAARCVAALLAAEAGTSEVSIETESAILGARVNEDGTVTIDIGRRASIGTRSRSPSRSTIPSASSCRSGRSTIPSCIRPPR